jgi:Major capsid protein N-terminus/Large eukaryotic DNA virus major capsid protein
MSGGITQLVSTGVQDVHLTGSPQVSFFRSQYRQYTHFAHSVERQIIQGQPTPGGISTIRVERKGDLLSYMYLTARDTTGKLRTDLDWTQIIDRVEVLIGGQVIDLQDPFYTYVIDPVCMANKYSQRYYPLSQSIQQQDNPFYPLKFFFCKEWQTALPLIALQMHDVDIRITWSQNLASQFPQNPPTGVNIGSSFQDGSALYSISSGGPGTSATTTVSNVIGNVNLGAVVVGSNFTGLGYVSATSITSGAGTVTVQLANSQSWSAVSAGSPLEIQFYDPPAAGSLYVPSVPSGTTSVVATVNSTYGVQIVPGMVVTNLPTIAGLVYVSAVTYSANNLAATVTLNFPAQSFSAIVSQEAGFFYPNVSTEPTAPNSLQFSAWADFIYLDVNEREYFAKNKFDMLITQVQRVPIGTDYTQDIVFNHPVKFIASNVASYSNVNQQLLMQINGVDIAEYKSLPHWVDVPQYYHTPFGYHGAGHTYKVPVMLVPFCLDTASYQPTGTLNFSRIDNFRLKSVLASGYPLNQVLGSGVGVAPQGYFYAVNYNVLTIQSGMGGLRYGN